MISKLGLQLYTVRDYLHGVDEKTMDKTFERLVEMGYTEGQTAGWETDEYAALAKKHGMTIVGTHFDMNKIYNDPAETIRMHKLLGTTNIGIGAMPRKARTGYDDFMKFIDDYNKAAAFYAKEGFKLTYHNHSFEWVQVCGNKTMMDLMVENFDPDNISFVLDTCWVANAGADLCQWMRKLAGRIDILHLKDLKTVYINDNGWSTEQRLCEVGRGNIDWEHTLKVAEEIGVKHYVVEQDGAWMDNDPFKSLEISKKTLEKYIK